MNGILKTKLFSDFSLQVVFVCLGHHNKNSADWAALTTEILFLTILEVGKSKIRFWQSSVPGGISLPGLQMAILSLCTKHFEVRETGSLASLSVS